MQARDRLGRRPAFAAAHPAVEGTRLDVNPQATNCFDGGDRADFVFLTSEQLGRRYPNVSLAGLPQRGGAGLVISADVAAAEKALGSIGVHSGGGICVPPAAGNGTLLVFAMA